jgi:hypothetical protein
MIDWKKGEMPMNGESFYVRRVEAVRFAPYKPNSPQVRKGIKGRWQQMNDYGGWDNCAAPDGLEWCDREDFNKSIAGQGEANG